MFYCRIRKADEASVLLRATEFTDRATMIKIGSCKVAGSRLQPGKQIFFVEIPKLESDNQIRWRVCRSAPVEGFKRRRQRRWSELIEGSSAAKDIGGARQIALEVKETVFRRIRELSTYSLKLESRRS